MPQPERPEVTRVSTSFEIDSTVGVADGAVEAIVFGTVAGALGTGTLWWGTQAREARRLAIIAQLQRRVLLLATDKGGTLTVTEVAASLNLSPSLPTYVRHGARKELE